MALTEYGYTELLILRALEAATAPDEIARYRTALDVLREVYESPNARPVIADKGYKLRE